MDYVLAIRHPTPLKDWDLIYFNNPIEYEAINNVLKRNCVHHMSWWVGYTEDDYEVTTINGRNINDGLLNWFGSLNWASTNPQTPEPNDKLGKETCVRMKEGYFNDAMCYVKHQGPKRKNVGMGYICERKVVKYLTETRDNCVTDINEFKLTSKKT